MECLCLECVLLCFYAFMCVSLCACVCVCFYPCLCYSRRHHTLNNSHICSNFMFILIAWLYGGSLFPAIISVNHLSMNATRPLLFPFCQWSKHKQCKRGMLYLSDILFVLPLLFSHSTCRVMEIKVCLQKLVASGLKILL